MKKHLILRNKNIYYVSEGKATRGLSRARKLKSIHELITTIPIMKDWNWDYNVYEVNGRKLKRVSDSLWIEEYEKWKDDNPEDYKKLYSGTLFENLVRDTD